MYATSLGALFTELVGNLKDRGTIALVTPIELLLIMFPVEMAAPLDPVFQKMLSVIFSGTVRHACRITSFYRLTILFIYVAIRFSGGKSASAIRPVFATQSKCLF